MIGDNNYLKPTLSSLPLEILIYFHWHYGTFFFLVTLCLYTYKAVRYYYPSQVLGIDFMVIFLYCFVESSRLFLTSKGNKTAQIAPLVAGMLLSLPIVVLHVYYIDLQLYVLRADVVLSAVALALVGFEFLVGFFVTASLVLASRV